MAIKRAIQSQKRRCILTICAHNDDQLLGAGGTLIKYARKGIIPYTYVFSYGETSHPHIKPEIIAKRREEESISASRILQDRIHYFGIKEGRFLKDFTQETLARVIREKKPFRIFTHSPDDPHPDHHAVYKIVKKVLGSMDYKGDVYCFDVWNIFAIRTGNNPKLFVDISSTFDRKIEALKRHKSQKPTMLSLGWSIYFKAMIAGWQNQCRYAEVFYRISLRE